MESEGPNWDRLRNDQDFLAIFHLTSRLAKTVSGMQGRLCRERQMTDSERQFLIGYCEGVNAVRDFPDQELQFKDKRKANIQHSEGEREHDSHIRNMLSRGLRMVTGGY